MSRASKSHLSIIRKSSDGETPGIPQADTTTAADRAAEILGQAVMHAAMCWVACCLEEDAHSVEVARVGPGLFDAMVYLMNGETRNGGPVQFLRVKLDLSSGPALRCEVSPLYVE